MNSSGLRRCTASAQSSCWDACFRKLRPGHRGVSGYGPQRRRGRHHPCADAGAGHCYNEHGSRLSSVRCGMAPDAAVDPCPPWTSRSHQGGRRRGGRKSQPNPCPVGIDLSSAAGPINRPGHARSSAKRCHPHGCVRCRLNLDRRQDRETKACLTTRPMTRPAPLSTASQGCLGTRNVSASPAGPFALAEENGSRTHPGQARCPNRI